MKYYLFVCFNYTNLFYINTIVLYIQFVFLADQGRVSTDRMSYRQRVANYKRQSHHSDGTTRTKQQRVDVNQYASLEKKESGPSIQNTITINSEHSHPPPISSNEIYESELPIKKNLQYYELKEKEIKCWKNSQQNIWNSYVKFNGIPQEVGCVECKETYANVRCIDCGPTYYICQACIESSHKNRPFHKLEIWKVSNILCWS